MNIFWEELTAGLTNRDQLLRVLIRLSAAILCGGFIGLQRVRATKPSGLRTHTMVCLGTTVILLSCWSAGGTLEEAVSDLEMQLIRASLARHRWNISRVANELGLTRRGLYLKLSRYRIEKTV